MTNTLLTAYWSLFWSLEITSPHIVPGLIFILTLNHICITLILYGHIFHLIAIGQHQLVAIKDAYVNEQNKNVALF